MTTAEIASLIIGSLALAISAILLGLRIMEWLAKPDLHLDMDWMRAAREPTVLRLVIHNRGRASGVVRDIVLSPSTTAPPAEGGDAFYPYEVAAQLPVLIPAGRFAAYRVSVDPDGTTSFSRQLIDGTFTHAILIDQDKVQHAIAIPPLPDETPSRRSTYGRVAKR